MGRAIPTTTRCPPCIAGAPSLCQCRRAIQASGASTKRLGSGSRRCPCHQTSRPRRGNYTPGRVCRTSSPQRSCKARCRTLGGGDSTGPCNWPESTPGLGLERGQSTSCRSCPRQIGTSCQPSSSVQPAFSAPPPRAAAAAADLLPRRSWLPIASCRPLRPCTGLHATHGSAHTRTRCQHKVQM